MRRGVSFVEITVALGVAAVIGTPLFELAHGGRNAAREAGAVVELLEAARRGPEERAARSGGQVRVRRPADEAPESFAPEVR